jgi:hypothetical protein
VCGWERSEVGFTVKNAEAALCRSRDADKSGDKKGDWRTGVVDINSAINDSPSL